jgi:hypothetical protein
MKTCISSFYKLLIEIFNFTNFQFKSIQIIYKQKSKNNSSKGKANGKILKIENFEFFVRASLLLRIIMANSY